MSGASGTEPRVCRPLGAPGEVGRLEMMAHASLGLTAGMRCSAQPRKKVNSEGDGEEEEAIITRNTRKSSLTAPLASIARS